MTHEMDDEDFMHEEAERELGIVQKRQSKRRQAFKRENREEDPG